MKQLLFVFLLLPVTVNAEIYNCNGRWTNKPCEGRAMMSRVSEKPYVAEPGAEMKSDKRSLLHDLRMKVGSRQTALGRTFPKLESGCMRPDITVAKCREVVFVYHRLIDEEDKALREIAIKAATAEQLRQNNLKIDALEGEIRNLEHTIDTLPRTYEVYLR